MLGSVGRFGWLVWEGWGGTNDLLLVIWCVAVDVYQVDSFGIQLGEERL